MTVNVIEPGSKYGERVTELHLRIGKLLRFGRHAGQRRRGHLQHPEPGARPELQPELHPRRRLADADDGDDAPLRQVQRAVGFLRGSGAQGFRRLRPAAGRLGEGQARLMTKRVRPQGGLKTALYILAVAVAATSSPRRRRDRRSRGRRRRRGPSRAGRSCRSPTRCCGSRARRTGCRGAARSTAWGYSPLDQIDRSNVSRLKMVWARGMGTGTVEATPLVYDGVMYLPGPGDVIQAIDAKTGDLAWEYRRKLPRGRERRHQPQHRHLGHDAHRRQRRQPDLRRGRAHRQPGVGNGGDGREEAGARERGSDHRQRQGDHRPPVPARRRQRRLHRHRARREDRQGSVAHADDSAARRARLRDLGRRADEPSAGTWAPGWCRATTRRRT